MVGGGGVPPKNGFFLVGNGGVSELEGVSEGKVWLDALKCVWGKENKGKGIKGERKRGEINQNPPSLYE